MLFRKTYSLSQSYQLNENVRVTSRLVLPIGLANAIFYIGFLATLALLQYTKTSMDLQTYTALVEAATLVNRTM